MYTVTGKPIAGLNSEEIKHGCTNENGASADNVLVFFQITANIC